MTDYKKYINALRKCAKEHENDRTSTGHVIVSDLCQDTVNLLESLEQQSCEDDVSKFISRQLSLLEERMSSATNEGRWVEEEKCQYAIENLELVDEYIKAHPPVAPKKKTGWIPVSERLPEDSGHYLVTTVV